MKSLSDYRETLRHALEMRCARNPRYSLRSFARDLGLSPSRLSDVLKGRYGLSRAAAASIAEALGLSAGEAALFCDKVDSAHARDRRQREAARARLAATVPYQALTLDGFQVISDWYHYAILELSLTEGFQSSSEWIAKQLDLSAHVVKGAVDRLERLDLLVADAAGVLRATNDFTASPDGIPSDAIKKFHRQVLEKAMHAIEFQSVDTRDFSSVVVAVDAGRLPEAKREIKKFRRAFDAKFGGSGSKNKVYCLSTQFFCLQTKSGE